MSATLDNRAEIRRALLRLIGGSTSDGGLSEHEATSGDTLNHLIIHGIWEAQKYIVNYVDPDRWRKRSAAITWSGTDAADGGRYVALAADFMRLYGNRDRSALVEANGTRWGRLIDSPLDRYEVSGGFYWIDRTSNADRLWISRNSAPPGTLYYEYNYFHPDFSDDATAAEFHDSEMPLAVAFAGDYAMRQAFFPGSPEMAGRVRENLDYWKRALYVDARRTREPRKLKTGKTVGTRWWTGPQ